MEHCGRFVFYNNIYEKPKKEQPAVRDMSRSMTMVYTMVYTLIDHSSRPTRARGFTQLL